MCFDKNRKSWIKEQTDDIIIKYYDAWKAGEVTDNDWATYLWLLVENYAKVLAEHSFKGKGEFEDLMQSAALIFTENYKKFNPRITKAITYFNGQFKEMDREYRNEISKHYKQSQTTIHKILTRNGYSGIDDERLDAAKISSITNYPIKTVNEVLRQFSLSSVSYENIIESGELDSKKFLSPEDAYLKNEKISQMTAALSKLTPLENWLVDIMLINPSDPLEDTSEERKNIAPSYKHIVRILTKYPEYVTDYELVKEELHETIKESFLQMKFNSALKKLRNEYTKKEFISSQPNSFTYFVKQADEEDLIEALDFKVI